MYELHIAKKIRQILNIDDSLFEYNGNVLLANYAKVRELVYKINSVIENDEKVTAGELNAIGLIDEIYHYILHNYQERINPGVLTRAVGYLSNELGAQQLEYFISDFINLFPPKPVYNNSMSVDEYLKGTSSGKKNIEISLEEFIMLFIANENPAAKKFRLLFDKNYLTDKNTYLQATKLLQEFFKSEKPIGEEKLDVITFFKKPFELYPDDLAKQLFFIKEHWGVLLDEKFLERILTGSDLFKEEYKLEGFHDGAAPTVVPQYKGGGNNAGVFLGKSMHDYASESIEAYEEPEQFTPDVHWMPNVVLLAKNTYVWLDQISKKYGREIKTLDQIPDEELDLIASRNFNSIWLIGVWERSSASKKIKHIMGNIDAVASAYSLYDYVIAADLGGEEAYRNLDNRCKTRGIRLASDMVPNHTGIYSDWTINRPDYFIQRADLPYPNYKFTGENLSEDPNIEIRIEDGYYSKSDAAVVFEWKNKSTGEVRYIYHGNDGTNMPWNDTAQLDMLKEEVREAVIQKIFEVARKFSIIRFDAAMTLAKKHFQRLWYPKPGTGGDIPSRSEYAMTKKEFDQYFPKEFWREVVDRINEELPETLLLAEAFWLMEGYFVRTLGMHRVYNSAFMHMMMNEENDKYRDLITNTLEFDPDILKRYVNFMSNPDEETAIKQFGSGDKYFGVCILMSTLPGLPMFAHGQIEGFTEKYGMEYKRAYYNEQPNEWLIDRHNKEVFPILQKRYLFSDVNNFWLYDFIDDYGHINENVYAFTNAFGEEKCLVLYNNKYERAAGSINYSTGKIDKASKNMNSTNIRKELGIKKDANVFYIAKDLTSHKEYIFSGDEFDNGLRFELNGFEYRVLYGFTEVVDRSGHYRELKNRIGEQAVDNVIHELKKMRIYPFIEAYENLFNDKLLKEFIHNFIIEKEPELAPAEVEAKYIKLLKKVVDAQKKIGMGINDVSSTGIANFMASVRLLCEIPEEENFAAKVKYSELPKFISISKELNYHDNALLLLIYKFTELIAEPGVSVTEFIDKYDLLKVVKNVLRHSGRDEGDISKSLKLLRIIWSYKPFVSDVFFNTKLNKKKRAEEIIKFLNNDEVSVFIGKNEYKQITYFSKEQFDEFLAWMFTVHILEFIVNCLKASEPATSGSIELSVEKREELVAEIKQAFDMALNCKRLSRKSEYKFNDLLTTIKEMLEEEVN